MVKDRLLSDLELDAAIRRVDCVVLAHSNEGPSGLFGKAAAAGTRIVAAGAASLRADAGAIPEVAAWSPLDVVGLGAELDLARRKPRPDPIQGLSATDFCTALLHIETYPE